MRPHWGGHGRCVQYDRGGRGSSHAVAIRMQDTGGSAHRINEPDPVGGTQKSSGCGGQASFPTFKACDLSVAGKWYRDKFTLEPDEAAVVKQVGADGGDISAPHLAFGSVLMLCALPPEEGWDHKYGERPAGPKIRSEAKAAAAMCPDAPFAAELVRVAGGVAPAPRPP